MNWIGNRPAAQNKSKNELYVARDYAAFHRQYEQLTAIIRANLHPLTS
jgi:hypothetical protein